MDSGTQHAITAVEYQSDERFWYATAKGEIFRQVGGVPQLQVTDPNAIPFNDIAMQPGGNVGIAVGNSGTVYRTTDGATWSKVPALGLQTLDHDCVSGSPALEDVTGDLLSVTWADASTVYLAGKERVVLRSTDAGLTFSERNKQPNLTCRASELLYDITDTVFAGGVGYLVSDGTAHTWRTGEGLATDVLARARAVECGTRPRLALDPVDLNRLWAVAKCSSATAFTYSEDGGATFGTVGLPGDVVNGLADVAVAPGTLIAVGNSGEILISRDGRTASRWPGFGTLGNHNWQAVDLADGARGAVGGDDGVLLTTTLAATVPMPPGATPPGGPFPGPSPPPGLPPDPTPPPGPPPGPSPPPDPSPSPGPPADTSPPPGPTPPPGPSPPPILTPAPGASPGGAPAGGDRGAGPATQRGTPRLTLRLRTRHGARGRVWLRVTGALVLPDTMNRTAGCRGRVTLGIKAGGRTLVRRRVAILPNCSFGTRLLALRGSRLASATRLAVVAQFGGNRVLERAERSLSRRVG